jgi:DNA processing protein
MLCCNLGDDRITPLTAHQFHELRRRISQLEYPQDDADLSLQNLEEMCVPASMREQILDLLERDSALQWYLRGAEQHSISVLTRLDEDYPAWMEEKLHRNAPPLLFALGNTALLRTPCVSLVGSRRLGKENRLFAERIGTLAAEEGYTLVSGGAEGADTVAQEACLRHGGKVIVFTPERLSDLRERENVLYLSEEGYHLPFSAQRALNRNRLIHAAGEMTFVAQCVENRGGSWRGSVENLHHRWSPVYIFDDGSADANALMHQGAEPIDMPLSIRLLQDEISMFSM